MSHVDIGERKIDCHAKLKEVHPSMQAEEPAYKNTVGVIADCGDGLCGSFVHESFDVKKDAVVHSLYGESPFKLGMKHGAAHGVVREALMNTLNGAKRFSEDGFWFIHHARSTIALDSDALISAFRNNGTFGLDVANALVRLFCSLDKAMYVSSACQHNMWRHFLPATFAASVFDGENYLDVPKFSEMFACDHIVYDVKNCRMVIMPCPTVGGWVCYVWDFQQKSISVIDPAREHNSVAEVEWQHGDKIEVLHQALFDCLETFFSGWPVKRTGWIYNQPLKIGNPCLRNDTGVLAMEYARSFDGDGFVDISVDTAGTRAELLCMLLLMADNEGNVPDFIRVKM